MVRADDNGHAQTPALDKQLFETCDPLILLGSWVQIASHWG